MAAADDRVTLRAGPTTRGNHPMNATEHLPRAAHLPAPPPPPSRRERLPEIVGLIGAGLVAAAVIGFLTARWEFFNDVEKAMVLATAAAGLTVAGLWADARRRPLELVVGLCWATATLLVVAAVTLSGAVAAGQPHRIVIATAGLAAAVHAGSLLARRPASTLQQGALFGALLYAIGPPGTAVADVWDWPRVWTLLVDPVWGLFDPSYTVDAFALTGGAHLALGVAWLGLATRLAGRAQQMARVLGVTAAAAAALQLNVLASPVGAVAALGVVIAFLVAGLLAGNPALLTVGTMGCLVAGTRVLAALFDGAAVVTILVFAGGLAMLAWAFRGMRRRRGASDRPG